MKEAFPRAFDRLTSYAGQLKLIYAVRDPFARIESFWMELRSQHPDYVHHDFNKAVDVNRDWLTDSSNYLAQLEPFRRFYGDDSIHVVFYEDFCADPETRMRGCFRFLGIDSRRRRWSRDRAAQRVGGEEYRLPHFVAVAIDFDLSASRRSAPFWAAGPHRPHAFLPQDPTKAGLAPRDPRMGGRTAA